MENTNAERPAQEMISVIREWEQSGQSQKSFCQFRNIAHSKFYYWLRKVQKGQSLENQTDFVAIRIRHNKSAGNLDIQYPNGVIVKLHAPIDLVMVKSLLQIL